MKLVYYTFYGTSVNGLFMNEESGKGLIANGEMREHVRRKHTNIVLSISVRSGLVWKIWSG